MVEQRDRTDAAILKVLSGHDGAVGAAHIARELSRMGIQVSSRTVRFRLARLDAAGLTTCVSRRAGRKILPAGREELTRVHVVERLGFVAARVDVLAYRMTFCAKQRSGSIVAHVVTLRRGELTRALEVAGPVIAAGLGMGGRLAVAEQGDVLAGIRIPPGHIGLATFSSVVVNGLLLKRGIPVVSRFGGLLEMRDGAPTRFIHLIDYAGTTIDPLEIFIRSGMTRVADCVATGSGIIGASFCEVPAVALKDVAQAARELRGLGLSGIMVHGQPNERLLDIPVAEGRAGMIVVGGINPLAAMFEKGITFEMESLAGLEAWSRFRPFKDFRTMARRRSPYVD